MEAGADAPQVGSDRLGGGGRSAPHRCFSALPLLLRIRHPLLHWLALVAGHGRRSVLIGGGPHHDGAPRAMEDAGAAVHDHDTTKET
jgi:hypothetical protein